MTACASVWWFIERRCPDHGPAFMLRPEADVPPFDNPPKAVMAREILRWNSDIDYRASMNWRR